MVDTLLPSVAALCAPVFDARGQLVLGITSLGTQATFDPAPQGAMAQGLQAIAAQLSHELGYNAAERGSQT